MGHVPRTSKSSIVEHDPPSGLGLAAHALDREDHLLLDHSAIQDQPHDVVEPSRDDKTAFTGGLRCKSH